MAAPVFNGLDNTPTYTENSSAVLLDNNASITDADIGSSTPYTGATLTLARSTAANADDSFAGAPLNEGQVTVFGMIPDPESPGDFIFAEIIIGTYTNNDGTLIITFNDQATGDRITDVLRQLTYSNASETPPASVVVGYTFNNGETATGSITVTINVVNDPPSIDALDGSAVYQPGSGGVVLSPNTVLSDLDSPTLSGATVSFSGGFLGTDVLSANVGSTGITANYAGGVLTLSGTATVAQYRQVLASVTYSTTAADPTNGGAAPDRTLNWVVKDSANANSPTGHTTLSFGPGVDLDASGAGTGFATTFTQGGAAVAIADTDADITATFDAVSGVSVVLTNARAGDVLAATGGPLTVTVNNSPGQITLVISGSGSETDYENALKSVTFSSSSGNIDPTTRDVTVTVADSVGNPSLAAHSTITINGAVNDPGSAADDTATTAANTSLFVPGPGVLANDNDPDGLVVVTGAVATSGGGAIEFQPNGAYGYTPAANFSGTDTVVYTAQDPFGSQVSATLRITVNAPPGPPFTGTPGDDSLTATGNQQANGGLGTDTVTFNFRLVDATVTYSGNQIIIDGPSTHTVVSGFEIFKFTDGTVNNNDADPLVDDLFYYAKYHDVWNAHVDADAHFHSTGWKEGRDPDAFFSTVVYLSANPDVKALGVDPLTHFDTSGWTQGRVPSITFDPAAYLGANPDVAAAHIDPLRHYLANGYQEGRQPIAPTELLAPNGFDYVYYLNHNPDVAASGADPFQHFQTVGWKEGRNPNALFDTSGYLNTYLDVKAANVNPLDHYNQFGWHEGRDPSVGFDTTSYLSAYADVNAAHINPLTHFLDFGIHEGRSPFADGGWS
jgi:hypothetical protein